MEIFMGLKISIIGAGSTYTPELIEGIITRRDSLKIDKLCLMDINTEKLGIIFTLTERMLIKAGYQLNVTQTTNLDEAISGSDYILAQIRVGGLEYRVKDEKIPLKHGLLGQETTGAGGFMNALRTIPVMLQIAARIEALAPEAWLINFSNPSGIIADVLLNHTKVKTIGLCNVPINMINDARKLLPDESCTFDYDYVGLNHLSWITSVYSNGSDILPPQLSMGLELSTMKNIHHMGYEADLLNAVKGMPSSYLNYFYLRDEQLKHYLDAEKTRGEECMEIERNLLDFYMDQTLDIKPKMLEKRGGSLYSTAAISLVDAIENDKNETHVVNILNNGALDFMDNNDVVEIKCVVNKNGAKPVKINGFNNRHIIGLMKSVKAYEKLTIEAGLNGDYHQALSALLSHPLIGDYKKAKGALDEMLEANTDYLPQFKKDGRKG